MTIARATVAALVLFACSKGSSKSEDETPTAAATPVKTADAAATTATATADAAAATPVDAAADKTADDGFKVSPKPIDDKGSIPEKAKNLQLLPKHWTANKVKEAMKVYTKALGVKCDFCHDVKDYASDANKHKKVARAMIKMTRDMNKKFFKGKPAIGCRTCHHGKAEPE